MFSVIIPLYNKEQYISKAVHSVLKQSFTDFELIIIDDGSSDKSLEVVRSIKENRIIIIEQSNQGVSSARNTGVKASKYNYVAFLDADDWWDKQFLEEMKYLIEQYPEAGLYGSSFKIVKNGSEKTPNIGLAKEFKRGYIDYIKAYGLTFVTPFNCSFVIVQKEIFQTIGGFKSNLKFGEDFDLWLRIALQYKVSYNNTPLAFSNQDVAINQRALGSKKKWKPSEHYIFNQEYLKEEEKNYPDLKHLLDGLRVRSLIRFRINGWFNNEVNDIIKEIEFSTQPIYYKFIYKCPLIIVRFFLKIKNWGFQINKFTKILK